MAANNKGRTTQTSQIPRFKTTGKGNGRSLCPEVHKLPTLSYSKLKVEATALWEENAELKQKLSRQQNAVHTSKTAVKELQKENKELKQRLELEETQHKDSMTAHMDEWTSRASLLESKLRTCEEALEISGINPVTLAALDKVQKDKRELHTDATTRANILREKLEHNISDSQLRIENMKAISAQCQTMLQQPRVNNPDV